MPKIINILGINNDKLELDNIENHSIIIKNCNHLKITINSKINKITIENSKGILLRVNNLIIGIEINKSKYVLIYPLYPIVNIPLIDLYIANVFLIGNIEIYSNVNIISDKSEVYNITL